MNKFLRFGRFFEKKLKKGVAMFSILLLFSNLILPGLEVFANNPEPETLVWDYVYDEASWNNAYHKENSALKAYYDDSPSEDLWCAPNSASSEWHYGTDADKVGDEYPGCKPAWLGFKHAKGSTAPWIVIELPDSFSGIIEFNYNGGAIVKYPWGQNGTIYRDTVKEGGYGIASIPVDLGVDSSSFDPDLLVITVTPSTATPVWDYIHDEASWNAAYNKENSALKRYYDDNPSEDLWNTGTNQAPGFDDKIYTVKEYTDAACQGDYVEKQYKAKWFSDGRPGNGGTDAVQIITDLNNSSLKYYIPAFYNTPSEIFELFLNLSGGYAGGVEDLQDSASRYIKVESVSFGGENIAHSWQGAVNAPGATYPWAVVNLPIPYEGTISYSYNGGKPVYPYGTATRDFSNGYAIRNIPVHILNDESYKLGGSNVVDPDKLQIRLVEDPIIETRVTSYLSCDGETHLEEGSCADSIKEDIECIPSIIDEHANYTTTETWSGGANRYLSGECTFVSCKDGYHMEGTCVLDTYAITYVGAETGNNATSYNYETDITLANPEKEGYTFSGWTYRDVTVPVNPLTIAAGEMTGDVTFTAVWDPIEYAISYNLNDGEFPENATAPETYTIESDFTVSNPLKRDNFKFIGWTGTDLSSPVSTLTIKGLTGDRSYEVVWEEITTTGGEAGTGENVEELVLPDAGTKVSTGSVNVVITNDNVEVVEQFNADDYTGTNTPTTGMIIIQQKTDGAALSEAGESEGSVEGELTSEFVADTGMVADMQGVLDLKLVYVDTNGDVTPLGSVNFSEPVKIMIPIRGSATSVKVRVDHGEGYGLTGLTLNGNAGCSAGLVTPASEEYTGGDIPVNNGIALIYTCSASTFVAYTEAPKPTTPTYSGGGGGGSSSSYKCKNLPENAVANNTDKPKKNTDYTYSTNTGDVCTFQCKEGYSWDATESKCIEGTTTVEEETTDNEENNNEPTPMTEDEAVAKFGDEQIAAYKWALENGITTMDTVEKARLDQPLTRAELAKMMVVYMEKVAKKDIVRTDVAVEYKDVDKSLGDLYDYIQYAYNYKIMGINADGTPIEYFNPNGIVTRGEYATVFSRVLFGSRFNKEGADFYTNHLAALKAAGILKDTTPTMQEIRGWVMLMMYRSSQNSEEIQKVAAAVDEAAAPAEENNEEENKEEAAAENAEETTETSETETPAETTEGETTTGDVVEAPAENAEATTGDVAETPAE